MISSSIKPRNQAKNPGRTLYTQYEHDFFTPHTCQTQGRADNPIQNSTAQHQLPTLCCPNWGGTGTFSSSPPNPLSSVTSDLKGACRVKGHREAGAADAALMTHLGCKWPLSLLDKLTLIIQLTACIKTATHHISAYLHIINPAVSWYAFKWFSAL